MADRKKFSKRREDVLWRVVDYAITDFRIAVLRGVFQSISDNSREEIVYKHFKGLADKVAAKYREKLS